MREEKHEPQHLTLEVDDTGAVGAPARLRGEIIQYLTGHGECPENVLFRQTGGNRTMFLMVLREMVTKGSLQCRGKGVRGSPHIYSLPQVPAADLKVSRPLF